jgi:uncharacterized protein YjiS (DUF1127 family)
MEIVMKRWFKKQLIKLIKARQAEANRQIAMMQLSRMSDRELNDIGLTRGDIRRVVYDDKEYISEENKAKEYSKFGWQLHKTNHA